MSENNSKVSENHSKKSENHSNRVNFTFGGSSQRDSTFVLSCPSVLPLKVKFTLLSWFSWKKYTSGPRYWNVPVSVNTGTFLVYQYCLKMWYLRSLERAGVIQKFAILECKNGLVLSNTCVPVSGTWCILFPFSFYFEWFSLTLEWFSLVLRVIFTRLECFLRFSLYWRVTISLFYIKRVFSDFWTFWLENGHPIKYIYEES